MKTDKILRDIQLNLIKLANEIQKQREQRLKKTTTIKKEKRELVLLETSLKLNKVFEGLSYDVR